MPYPLEDPLHLSVAAHPAVGGSRGLSSLDVIGFCIGAGSFHAPFHRLSQSLFSGLRVSRQIGMPFPRRKRFVSVQSRNLQRSCQIRKRIGSSSRTRAFLARVLSFPAYHRTSDRGMGEAMDDARVFVCARCRLRVRICSRCDRGQRYCDARCSGIARRDAVREASRRFQQSRRGKLLHAERQERYRRKRREGEKKVTQQGSDEAPCSASLSRAQQRNPCLDPSVDSERTAKTRCHFCKRPVSVLARRGWRRGS